MAWNSTSGLTGLEWYPTRRGGVPLSLNGDATVAEFTSSVTETQTGVGVYFEKVSGAPRVAVDFYAAADVPQVVTTATFLPNEDIDTTNFVRSTGAGTWFSHIDDSTVDETDYLTFVGGQNGSALTIRVASAGGIGAGRLVTEVRLIVAASGSNAEVGGRLQVSGTPYLGAYEGFTGSGWGPFITSADGIRTLTFRFPVNPRTGAAWTNAEIQAFDGPSDLISIFAATSVSGPVIYDAWLEVDHVPAALGTVTLSPTEDGWLTGALSASFSKTITAAFKAVIRKTNTDGRCVVPWIDSGAVQIHGHTRYDATVTSSGLVSDLDDEETHAHPLLLDISGTASVDSMPYATYTREAVYTGRTVEQELTPGTSPTIGYAKVVIARQGYVTGADLLVKIKRRSDNVQIGGTWTITADNLPNSITALQVLEGNLASTGALVSGTQYYLEFSSTAASGEGWVVGVLDSLAAPLTGDAAGYGAATNAATVAGVESDDKDVPFVVGTVPSAPVVTATAAADHVDVDWTDTGDTFHVFRGGTLIEITTLLTFDDYQARQGVEESYTVKAETDANGTLSLPSTADTATMTASEGWQLRSNQLPSINLTIYPTVQGVRREYLDDEDQTVYPVYGADNSRVEEGMEDRGLRISMTVETVASGGLTTYDDAMFDVLRAIRDAVRAGTVTDLALLSPYGRRWFVSMRMPEANTADLLQLGYVPVVFTTVNPTL